jgi:hypothetical protein
MADQKSKGQAKKPHLSKNGKRLGRPPKVKAAVKAAPAKAVK